MKRQIEDIVRLRVSEKRPALQILLGPRQVGKTTAAKAVYEGFRGSRLFASADSPAPLMPEWIEARWLQARAQPEPVLLIIDEVQKVTGWSEIVKRLFDEDRHQRDMRVLLLGSASLSLQSGLNESLAGRFELIRADHWNLAECERAFGWGLDQFLQFGGYPAAARYIKDCERWQSFIRDSIIEPVLGRDILSSIAIAKPALFRQVFEVALHYPAQELSYQKIIAQLQERGSVETVKHYLRILEGAFLLRQIFKYSRRPLSTRESSPKLITMASALPHGFVDPRRVEVDADWRGRVFESAVGAALSRAAGRLFYWRERGDEVDFVLETNDRLFAVEVKSGRRARRSGLEAFLRKYPKARPAVVTPHNCSRLLSDEDPVSVLERL